MIFEVGPLKPPVELHRMQLKEDRLKVINERWLAWINGVHFNLLYFKAQVSSSESVTCKEEHYSPGLKGDPVLLTCSYSK